MKRHRLKKILQTMSKKKIIKLCKKFNICVKIDNTYVKKNGMIKLLLNKKVNSTNGRINKTGGAGKQAGDIGSTVAKYSAKISLIIAGAVLMISVVSTFYIINKSMRLVGAGIKSRGDNKRQREDLKNKYRHDDAEREKDRAHELKLAQFTASRSQEDLGGQADEEKKIEEADAAAIPAISSKVSDLNKTIDGKVQDGDLKLEELELEESSKLQQEEENSMKVHINGNKLEEDIEQVQFIVHIYRQLKSNYTIFRRKLHPSVRMLTPHMNNADKKRIKQTILEIVKEIKKASDQNFELFVNRLDIVQSRTTSYFYKRMVYSKKWKEALPQPIEIIQQGGNGINHIDSLKSYYSENKNMISDMQIGGDDESEAATKIARSFRAFRAKREASKLKKTRNQIIDSLIAKVKGYIESSFPTT
jgi:hypothetical protein